MGVFSFAGLDNYALLVRFDGELETIVLDMSLGGTLCRLHDFDVHWFAFLFGNLVDH